MPSPDKAIKLFLFILYILLASHCSFRRGENKMEVQTRIFFLGNACHVCKSKKTPFACDICRMIFYCSAEHRRDDWFHHSQICWAVNKICGGGRTGHLYELLDKEDFTKFRHDTANKCRELLQRNLTPWEFEMIYYNRICGVCREFDWKKLEPCKDCEFVYTCGKKHFRKDHRKWCRMLKTYSEIIIHQSCGGGRELEIPECRSESKSHLQSMEDLLVEKFGNGDKNSEVEKALTSEFLTYPLTVLNALKHVNVLGQRQVDVLFIGAETQAEVEPLEKWEKCLLHNLEATEILNLKFLGPELRLTPGEVSGDLCLECRRLGKSLKCEFVTGKFYHEYKETKKSDLICAFNSGMYRDFGFQGENSWEDTILELFARGESPVMITEYTWRELKMVLERIGSLCGGVSVVLQPQENPFAGLKPGLNIISEEETPVIFKNYFHAILQNKKPKPITVNDS